MLDVIHENRRVEVTHVEDPRPRVEAVGDLVDLVVVQVLLLIRREPTLMAVTRGRVTQVGQRDRVRLVGHVDDRQGVRPHYEAGRRGLEADLPALVIGVGPS